VPPLTSPRSIFVCMREGIDPDTLKFKLEADFKSPGVPDDLVKMSFEHHETIRQDRLRSLIGQRDRVEPDRIQVPAFVPGAGKAGLQGTGPGPRPLIPVLPQPACSLIACSSPAWPLVPVVRVCAMLHVFAMLNVFVFR